MSVTGIRSALASFFRGRRVSQSQQEVNERFSKLLRIWFKYRLDVFGHQTLSAEGSSELFGCQVEEEAALWALKRFIQRKLKALPGFKLSDLERLVSEVWQGLAPEYKKALSLPPPRDLATQFWDSVESEGERK